MAYLDIILFAAIAIFLVLRLRSVLGQKNPDEPQRPNPFVPPAAQDPENGDGDSVIEPDRLTGDENTPQRALPKPVSAPTSLAGGLELIRAVDPRFEEKDFLKGARAAFAIIVEAFARGDTETLRRLLAPQVFASFDQAITARKAAGQTLESKIVALRDADLTAAQLEGDTARVTVHYVSTQINVTRDDAGTVIDGDPAKAEDIDDIWIFARNVRDSNPNWILVETRS